MLTTLRVLLAVLMRTTCYRRCEFYLQCSRHAIVMAQNKSCVASFTYKFHAICLRFFSMAQLCDVGDAILQFCDAWAWAMFATQFCDGAISVLLQVSRRCKFFAAVLTLCYDSHDVANFALAPAATQSAFVKEERCKVSRRCT